jgi:two-component system cell cycle response regulator DivK
MSDAKRKIIVFDDDADTLSICSIILSSHGYEVHTSSHANDVLSRMRDIRPDVVLMDNWIPDIGGISATRLIKGHEDFKHTPVVYFSANTEIQKLASEAGADAYISKPFDVDALEKLIDAAAEGRLNP